MTEHVTFRDYRPEDGRIITFGEPGALMNRLQLPEADAVVAEWHGEIVGYAVSWLAVVHRTRRFMNVEVAPDSRGRRIGSRLVAHLASRSRLPLATKAVEGSDAEAFIRALGGSPYAVCPPLELPRRHFRKVVEELGEANDVVAASALSPGLAEHLWEQVYLWVHADWSPVADTKEAQRTVRQEAGELDLDHTGITLVDGEPVAAAFVFDDPGAPTVVAETVAPDVPEGDVALARAVSWVVEQAQERGVHRLAFDGHESDPHFGPLARRLPLEGARLMLLELPLERALDADRPHDTIAADEVRPTQRRP